ncbi:MAG: arginyltransferase [Pseudomonadales bacterium]|nr:arginyltransferase [Pseudomonadales bacterium]
MSTLADLKFYSTPSHDCSYLQDQQAVTLFADPLAIIDTDLYSALSEVGFRRSGQHIYKPYCDSCTACIPVRLAARQFEPLRRHKRTIKRNADLDIKQMKPSMTDEYFLLYQNYISARHADGDMHPASEEQFDSFLVSGRPEAIFFEFRFNGKLLAVAVTDQLNNAMSAIYTFFDPNESRRSLGSFAVLWLIEETQRIGIEYLYLGYWIKECQKMSYKMDYKPLQIYVDEKWRNVN